ncbi:retention module-containing protein, partial [Aeromonas rivipollensis]|uniref:retention module-containing protein n=1 Tax=Aeromonas rivipollensis TaxID=948519 RepID=UPI003988CB3C
MRTQIIDKTVVVSSVEGNVQILLADGSSRPLQPGEILQPGAKLNIADDAKLMLAPYDDNPGQAAAAPAETDIPAEGQPSSSAENSNLPPEIAALQESILQGVDPTKDFEAAAAGGAPAAGGGGGIGGVAGASGNGGFVVIDRVGDATIAEAGFDTSYDALLDQNVLQEDDLLPENELDDLGEAVVTLEDSQVSGNLLENSTNPDGPADASIVSYDWGINIGVPVGVAATITGVGTLIINSDGSYTFTPAPNYDGAVPPINYQVTDGQDTVTSTLVISITPVDEEVGLAGLAREGGEVQVSDTNLADGSAPNAAALTQSGVFTFNAPDGVQSLTLGGVTLITNGQLGASFPQSIISPFGNVLTITAVTYNPVTGAGQVSYSYTLGDNEDHTRPANDTSLSESFNVVLIDSDGDTASDTLDVTILDDIPTLADGEEQSVRSLVHEDALASGNSEGAEQNVSTIGLAGTLNGLVNFGADGAGSFGLGSDISSLEEQALTSGGVALSYGVAGNVLTASAGGVQVFTLTVGADGSYSFTLSGPLDHPVADGNDSELLSGGGIDFSGVLTATDGDGDPLVGGFPAGSFMIDVQDDVPVATNDGLLATLSENSSGVTIGTTATLLGDDNYGADGAAAAGSLVIGTGDKGGTVTIDVNGNLVYTNTSQNVGQGETVTETFTYTIKDADGDTAEATFTVNLTDTGVTIGAAPANLLADEDNLAAGVGNTTSPGDDAQVLSGTISYTLGQDAIGSITLSTAGNATGLKTLAGQDVVTTFSNGTLIGYISGTNPLVATNQVFAITLGTLGASSTGYTMTLFQPVKHASAGTEDNTTPFTVNVVVADADGSTANTSFTVSIDDDMPIATNDDLLATLSENSSGVTIGTTATLLGDDNYGADGAAATGSLVIGTGDKGGTVTIDVNGNLVYT